MKNTVSLAALVLSAASCAAVPRSALSQPEEKEAKAPEEKKDLEQAIIWEPTTRRIPFANHQPKVSSPTGVEHHYYIDIPAEHVEVAISHALAAPHEEAWIYDHTRGRLYEVGRYEAEGSTYSASYDFLNQFSPMEVTLFHTHPIQASVRSLEAHHRTVQEIHQTLFQLMQDLSLDHDASGDLQQRIAQTEEKIQDLAKRMERIKFMSSVPSDNDWHQRASAGDVFPSMTIHSAVVCDANGYGIIRYDLTTCDSALVDQSVDVYMRLVNEFTNHDFMPELTLPELQTRFIEAVHRETNGVMRLETRYFSQEEKCAFEDWAKEK